MKMHYLHPCFAHRVACGREITPTLLVSFGGAIVTCEGCRDVLRRLIGAEAKELRLAEVSRG